MTSKSMTFRFSADIAQAIEAQARATGRDRTTVVVEALTQVFGLSLTSKVPVTLEVLQQQVEAIETSIKMFTEQLVASQKIYASSNNSHLSALLNVSDNSSESSFEALCECEAGDMPTNGIVHSSQELGSLQQADLNRVQLSAWLEPQTDLLEQILATTLDPVFVCNCQRRLIYINSVGVQVLGLQSNAVQQTIQAFDLPPELKAQLTTQVETVFATGRSIIGEISLTTPLWGLQAYEYTLSPIQGKIEHIHAVLFSTKNITQHKRVEVALRQAEANYQNLLESTKDSVLILDALTQQIVNANTHASRRLGYARQELFNLNIDDIAPRWSTTIASQLSQRLQTQDEAIFDHWFRHKDGSGIAFEVCSCLVEYGDRLVIQNLIREVIR